MLLEVMNTAHLRLRIKFLRTRGGQETVEISYDLSNWQFTVQQIEPARNNHFPVVCLYRDNRRVGHNNQTSSLRRKNSNRVIDFLFDLRNL